MRCSEARRLIGDLGERTDPPTALAQHLAGCPACARLLDEQRAIIRQLQNLPWPEARLGAPRFPVAPLTAGAGIGAPVGGRDRVTERPRPERLHLRLAEVAALVLALAIWALVLAAPAREPWPTAAGTVTSALQASPTAPPQATRVGDDGDLPEQRAVTGRPVSLLIASDWRPEEHGECRQVWLEPGDGTVRPLTCPSPAEVAASRAASGYPGMGVDPRWGWRWTVELVYGVPEAYFPQLHVILADSAHLVQSIAQVIVTPEPPSPAWLVRWRSTWLRATLALLALAVLGLAIRRPWWRAAALVVGLLALATLALGTWADRGPLIAPYLDNLVGTTGLDPLDPAAPLIGYRIDFQTTLPTWDLVHTTFRYRDGRERRYAIPIDGGGGFVRDGLGRLRTEHRELDGLPFADPDRDGLGLGTPRLVAAAPAVDWGPDAWFSAGCLATGNLVAAPDSRHVLFGRRAAEMVTLSVIDLATGQARYLADNATDYVWSPDGQAIAVVVPRGEGAAGLALYHLDGQAWRREDGPAVSPGARPGTTGGEVWFAAADGIWAVDLRRRGDGGAGTRRVTSWPEANDDANCPRVAGQLVRPSPDGGRVAYACGAGLVIQNLRQVDHTVVPGDFADAAWSPDGVRLAVLERYTEGAAWLLVVGADGKVEGRYKVATNGTIGRPEWSADGRRLFLATCPLDGRRIVTVDRANGTVRDLSRRRWDAWSSYLAQPESLLLANGRGGLWRAELLRTAP